MKENILPAATKTLYLILVCFTLVLIVAGEYCNFFTKAGNPSSKADTQSKSLVLEHIEKRNLSLVCRTLHC